MVLPSDILPLFYAATFFGCAPHAISAENDFVVTKRGTVYSILCFSFFLSASLYGVYLIATETRLEAKLLLLTGIRTLLSYLCLFLDGILGFLWNRKLGSAVAQLRAFDRAVDRHFPHVSTSIRVLAYLVLLVVAIFWLAVGYVSFRCETQAPLFNALTYGLVNAAISMQLVKFVCLAYLVGERFRKLARLLSTPQGAKTRVAEEGGRQFRLQEVWWLHSSLADAFELINLVYATQLLFWVVNFSLNTLSRIYTITENHEISQMLKVRESLLVSAYVVCLLLIAVACHVTSAQANRIGNIAFSPLSRIAGRRSIVESSVEAATYFQLRKLHFYGGGGLICIDLSLLLSIASGITTYLVMLHAANRENDNDN